MHAGDAQAAAAAVSVHRRVAGKVPAARAKSGMRSRGAAPVPRVGLGGVSERVAVAVPSKDTQAAPDVTGEKRRRPPHASQCAASLHPAAGKRPRAGREGRPRVCLPSAADTMHAGQRPPPRSSVAEAAAVAGSASEMGEIACGGQAVSFGPARHRPVVAGAPTLCPRGTESESGPVRQGGGDFGRGAVAHACCMHAPEHGAGRPCIVDAWGALDSCSMVQEGRLSQGRMHAGAEVGGVGGQSDHSCSEGSNDDADGESQWGSDGECAAQEAQSACCGKEGGSQRGDALTVRVRAGDTVPMHSAVEYVVESIALQFQHRLPLWRLQQTVADILVQLGDGAGGAVDHTHPDGVHDADGPGGMHAVKQEVLGAHCEVAREACVALRATMEVILTQV